MKTVTVCIPAYNEGPRIAALLERVVQSGAIPVSEILVCVNGCTDNTADIVGGYARTDKRIGLLESERGKPNAWNRLFEEAANDILVFFDADVRPRQNCIENLVQALVNGDCIVAGCSTVTKSSARGLEGKIVNLLRTEFFFVNYLNGAGYSLKRPEFLKKMQEHGYRKMPSILPDDGWVQMLLEPEDYKLVAGAVIEYDSGTFADYLRGETRTRMIAYPELKACSDKHSPGLYEKWLERLRTERPTTDLGKKLRRFLVRLKEQEGISRKIEFAFYMVLKTYVRLAYRSKIRAMSREMRLELQEADGACVLGGTGRKESKEL